MFRPLPSGLRLALVVAFPVVVVVVGCSGDDDSSSPGINSGGTSADAGGAGAGGEGATGEAAKGGGAGHVSSTGGANGGGAGGQPGAEAAAGAPDAGAAALGGGPGEGGAGGDSSDNGPKVIASGPYAIAYTSLPGTDSHERAPVTATFANTGELTGYVYAAGTEDPTIGTNVASEVYMDASSALGRWSSGTAGGHYFASTLTWTANQGLHYAIGIPTPVASLLTSGSTSYAMLAATHPTVYPNNLSPGAVTAGAAKVSWGDPVSTISVTLSVTTGAGDYSIASTANSQPATSAIEKSSWSGSAPATGTGPACAGSNCQGRFQGFIGGNVGQRLGCEFVITSSGTAYTVRGAVLFGKP